MRYEEITLDQMKQALEVKQGNQFQIVQDQYSKEVIFERAFIDNTQLVLRVYSSITHGVSRGCGKDAVRCIIFDKILNKPVGKTNRTNRVSGWQVRLKEKLNELAKSVNTLKHCPKCNNYLVLRKGKDSKFWGCSSFPNCKHTEVHK